jgi:hypothetical protein
MMTSIQYSAAFLAEQKLLTSEPCKSYRLIVVPLATPIFALCSSDFSIPFIASLIKAAAALVS